MMSKLYKELKVWRHENNETAIRFNCFFDLDSELFAVQSADFFHLPLTTEQIESFEKQYVELFIEISPYERCDWFKSLEEAISAHDRDFSNEVEHDKGGGRS